MKSVVRFTVALVLAWMLSTGLYARSATPGGAGGPGGHSASGGHGHGGRGGFSSGRSSANGAGHAIGHSFGRLFGRRSQASNPAPGTLPSPVGAAFQQGKLEPLPSSRRFHHRPVNDFPFGDRFPFFTPRRAFGFGGCAAFGSRPRFFFSGEFDCFSGGFFFDPFFIRGFSSSFIAGPAFLPADDQGLSDAPDDFAAAPELDGSAAQQSGGATRKSGNVRQDAAANERPVTLLQLLDGSMYGLTDYWSEHGQLHYTTTYGGQDSIGLDRIDFAKTLQLNAGRGVEFVLRPTGP